MNSRINVYKFEDSVTNLWTIVFVNLCLLFCLLVPDIMHPVFGFHETVLLAQALLLSAFYKYGTIKSKSLVASVFVAYAVSTAYEAYVWIAGLNGIVPGAIRGSKGAPFAFFFESPPYIYPLIRLATILLFVPILRLFSADVWE